jgi:hypothetical protein
VFTSLMKDDRKERRNPERVQVVLSNAAEPWAKESASVENLNSHGLRLRTERLWEPDTRVLVKSSDGEFLAYGQVVYCQTWKAGMFALGLKLLVLTGMWIIRSWA